MTVMVLVGSISDVMGVPETMLSDALIASLPSSAAPAPWTCACMGLLWLGRGGAPARDALPRTLRRNRVLGTLGGFVRYRDTPVGTYDEVLGMVAARDGARPFGHVAFMAVDSPTSLVGGRANWAMPKTLAEFEGEPADRRVFTARGTGGVDWRVSATPRTFGPAIPVRARATARQELADGSVRRAPLTCRGRVRLAVLSVEVESTGSLPTWLRSGCHLGAVVESATFTLGEPTSS